MAEESPFQMRWFVILSIESTVIALSSSGYLQTEIIKFRMMIPTSVLPHLTYLHFPYRKLRDIVNDSRQILRISEFSVDNTLECAFIALFIDGRPLLLYLKIPVHFFGNQQHRSRPYNINFSQSVHLTGIYKRQNSHIFWPGAALDICNTINCYLGRHGVMATRNSVAAKKGQIDLLNNLVGCCELCVCGCVCVMRGFLCQPIDGRCLPSHKHKHATSSMLLKLWSSTVYIVYNQ